jgi:DNA-binding response OmpR family regulator
VEPWTERPGPVEPDAVLYPVADLPDRPEILRIQSRGIRVLAWGKAEHLRAAFLAGCDDYLREPWNPVELACRLERLRADRSEAAGPTGVHPFPWGELHLRDLAVCSPRECLPLSLPEYRILAVLLRHRGTAVSREVLRYAAWGRGADRRSRAVDVHVSSLRRKILKLFPASAGCLRCLRGVGYTLA